MVSHGGTSPRRMEAKDLLDAIHYVYEVDSLPLDKEVHDARARIRYTLYHELYKRETRVAPPMDTVPSSTPADPTEIKYESKAYVPPTPVQADAPLPFGGVLDAPLG